MQSIFRPQTFTRTLRPLATATLSLISLFLILALGTSPLHAQTGGQGALQGTVTDATGAVVPGATVSATDQASGVVTTRTASSAGLYSITPLIPGVYNVSVKAAGFETLNQQNIEVNGLNVTGFNVKLAVGSTEQTVTVSEAPPQLDTTSATLNTVITNETYESLPLVANNQQRDPTAFATLAPGAQGGARAPIIAGTGNYLAEVYVDGIPTTTPNQQGDNRVVSNSLPVETIDQLQVVTSGPSAEYQGAGAIGFTTKSGGNQYHGTILDLIRNTVFDTWGFAGNQATTKTLSVDPVTGKATLISVPTGKQIEHQNELSVSAGGPIPLTRKKGFFFANYDKYHGRQGVNPGQFSVATARMKAGDFSQLLGTSTAGCTPGVGGCTITGQIYDPTTTAACTANSTSGTPCRYQYGYGPGPVKGPNGNPVLIGAANVIPASEISPISKYEQQFLPDPQVDTLGLNTQYGGVSGFDNHEITFKVDFDITAKQRVSFFYSHGVRASIGYGAALPVPYAASDSSVISPTMMIFEHSFVITPHIVNQFKYGFTRFPQPVFAPTDNLAPFRATDAGITGLPPGQSSGNFPGTSFSTSTLFPTALSNFTQGGASDASHNVVPNSFTIVDNLQIAKGKHAITVGFEMQWLQDNVTSQSSPSGIYTQNFNPISTSNFVGSSLNSTTTGFSYASFLIGAVNSAGTSVPLFTETAGRFRPISPYVQDDWKIRPNLTLNIGLRYDYLPPYHEGQDRFSFFNATGINPITGTPGLLEFAGNRGNDISCNCRTPVNPYWKNFGPRLGLAWSVDDRTVVHAGFAIAYSRAGGVGGRGGDSNGSGQSGFGSNIILNPAVNTGPTAQPSFYLNNSPAFTALGLANTNFGGPQFAITPPTGPSAASLTLGTGNYTDPVTGKYITAGGAPGYLDPYLAGRGPQFEFFNFGIQKALTQNLTINVNYAGSQSHFVAGAGVPGFWSGQLDPSFLVTLGSVLAADKATNILNAPATPANIAIAAAADPRVVVPYAGFANTANTSVPVSRALRPFPQYSNSPSPTFDNIANISYNSFQFTLAQRQYKGVNFTLNYTYSRNMGDDGTTRSAFPVPAAASSNGYDIPGNNRADRDLVTTDVPEQLNLYGLAKSPFGKGLIGSDHWLVRNLAGGWALSGIFTYSAGSPVLITASGCNTPNSGTCMPDLVPGRKNTIRENGGYNGPGRTYANYNNPTGLASARLLDPTAFTLPNAFPLPAGALNNAVPLTKIGDSPRSNLNVYTPSRNNLDLSVRRTFNLVRERVKFQFQADCFNVANKVDFSISQTQTWSQAAVTAVQPGATSTQMAASSFGNVNGFGGRRVFQFLGRINF